MLRHSRIPGVLRVVACIIVFQSIASGQERSIGNAIHEMAYEIALEVLAKAGLSATDSTLITFEAADTPSYVQNAFLRAIQEQSIRVLRPSSDPLQGRSIHVLVLEQDVQYVVLDSVRWERNIGLEVEVTIDQANGSVSYLGMYSKRANDIVRSREVWPSQPGERYSSNSESSSPLLKILGPVLTITGTVIMIYLFFTVRS